LKLFGHYVPRIGSSFCPAVSLAYLDWASVWLKKPRDKEPVLRHFNWYWWSSLPISCRV